MMYTLALLVACLAGGVGGALGGHWLVERFKARR